MNIRLATLSDEDDVRACAEDAYQQYVAAIGQKPAPMIANFGKQISEGLVHVILSSQELLGFIVFYVEADHMFVENVAVKSSSTGQGIGTKLLTFCEGQARRQGVSSIKLYTNEKMAANISIYRHFGYLETARRHEGGFDRVYFEKVLG